jgi:hypothetical protein
MSRADTLHAGGPTKDALFDFVAGRLHRDAAQWIGVHVQTCPTCTEAIERLTAVREAMEAPAESPFQRQKDINAVRRRLAEPKRAPRRRFVWLGAGGFLTLAATAALIFFVTRPQPPKNDAPAAVAVAPQKPAPASPHGPVTPWSLYARQGAADVEMGDDHATAHARQSLGPGGVLSLQPGARVLARWGAARVAVLGGDKGARVRLEESRPEARTIRLDRGRVELDVDPLGAGQTVAVVTPDARVTVHGTIFLVDVTSRGTHVAVDRGVVRVERGGKIIELREGTHLDPEGTAATPRTKDQPGAFTGFENAPAMTEVPPETLDVQADAPNATVTVDSVLQGAAPLSIAVTAGSHRVRVIAPGRLPVEETIEVVTGSPALLRAELPLPPPEPAVPRTQPALVLKQARADVMAGNYKKAIERLESLRHHKLEATDAARAALLEAEAQRLGHKPQLAVPLLEKVAKSSGPEAEQAQLLLGQTLARDLFDPRRAARAFAESQRRFPKGIFREESAYRLGESLLAAGETREGVEALERYLAEFPRASHADDAHMLVAAARRDRLGDCAGAVPHLRAVAASRGPRAGTALVGHARCLKTLGRTDEAKAAYRRYLEVAPGGRFSDEARAHLK